MNHSDRGSILVELALIFPFLAALFIFAASASSLLQADQYVSALTREAANVTLRSCTLNEAADPDCTRTVRNDIRFYGEYLFKNQEDFDVTISVYECAEFSCSGPDSCSCNGSAVARTAFAAQLAGSGRSQVFDPFDLGASEETGDLAEEYNLWPPGFGEAPQIGNQPNSEGSGAQTGNSPIMAETRYNESLVSERFLNLLNRRGFVVIAEGKARTRYNTNLLGIEHISAQVIF